MKLFLIFCSKFVVIPNNYSLLYYLESMVIDEGLYARHAILKALKVDAGNPQQEKHFLFNSMILFLTLFVAIS